MEYKQDKRTKNLTLRDIHVGDWVQVWSDTTERYSPPLKITQICDDGTVYLIIDEENRLDPLEENIKYIDALLIDEDLLRGFGFSLSEVHHDDWGDRYKSVNYGDMYVGQIRCTRYDLVYFRTCGYECRYLHKLFNYWQRNGINIKLEWKGFNMRKEQLDNFVSGLNAMRRERLECNLSNTDMIQSEIDWEQRRYEIAKEMLPAIYVNDKPKEGEDYLTLQAAAHEAVRYADALINELKEGGEK